MSKDNPNPQTLAEQAHAWRLMQARGIIRVCKLLNITPAETLDLYPWDLSAVESKARLTGDHDALLGVECIREGQKRRSLSS